MDTARRLRMSRSGPGSKGRTSGRKAHHQANSLCCETVGKAGHWIGGLMEAFSGQGHTENTVGLVQPRRSLRSLRKALSCVGGSPTGVRRLEPGSREAKGAPIERRPTESEGDRHRAMLTVGSRSCFPYADYYRPPQGRSALEAQDYSCRGLTWWLRY
ncbi:hypothetical protein NDU88_000153 [Pleurodeles waltl]|uniref:Uncharacterized protein n=1 Tax=Pleurodeles waltl TaxID=8319 RepID=A0AAV7VXK3_PLEWA|nr:hypothetical protein NDU88_000153 [Pleurodeles waltl]